MASDLLSIAKSGARTARMALDVAANNIANASSDGYIRRTVRLEEMSASSSMASVGSLSLSGVRLGGVVRNADAFRQSEVRRTGSDLARADAELSGLRHVESALEDSGVYAGIVDFEAALAQLESDPVDRSLRAATIEAARTMAGKFNLADASLNAAAEGAQFAAASDVAQINKLSEELGRINVKLARSPAGAGDQASLLDRRDLLLGELSQKIGIHTTVSADKTVEVRIGDVTGPVLLSGASVAPIGMATNADGTIALDLGGSAIVPGSGSLSGHAQALDQIANVRVSLGALAMDIGDAVNAAQAGGAALDGSAGIALFTGTGAGNLALATDDGAMIATAGAGSPAYGRDTANLSALRNALSSGGMAGAMDALLFDVSATINGRNVTRETLFTIADNANIALQAQAGVDLDEEAVNLVRFQQAFQASGRVMQVASDTFDTILGIR